PSEDLGLTWTKADAPLTNWSSIASSADGSRLLASTGEGALYMSQVMPEPVLRIVPRDTSVLLSWVVPPENFVLQQNSDLSSGNWTDVSVTPVLNHTNLHYEVTVPANAGAMFHWLAGKAP